MESIVLYGLGFGVALLIMFILIFIIKISKHDIVEKVSTHMLPFIGVASLFASLGLSVIIECIYDNNIYSEKAFTGLVFIIIFIVILVIYIINYINEIKRMKISEQNEKNEKW